jgi:hypothetical protein
MKDQGKKIPERAPSTTQSPVTNRTNTLPPQEKDVQTVPDASWPDVTVTLLANYRIKRSIHGSNNKIVLLNEVGLARRRNDEPNVLFSALSDIAHGHVFGAGARAGNTRKNKCLLRKSLCNLVGMEGDPFLPRDKEFGYKPRFKLVDHRGDADERAKRAAIEERFKETSDFALDDDAAGEWLQEHDQ